MTFYNTCTRSLEGYFRAVVSRLDELDVSIATDGDLVYLCDGSSGGRVLIGSVLKLSVRVGVLAGYPHDRYPFYAFASPAYLFSRVVGTLDVLAGKDDALSGAWVGNPVTFAVAYDDWSDPGSFTALLGRELWESFALSVCGEVFSLPSRGIYVLGVSGGDSVSGQ